MRKKIAGIILAAIILLPFGGNVVQAAVSCGGNPGVTFYENINLGGLGHQICGTTSGGPIQYNLGTIGWSDRISSYWYYNATGSGRSLRLYLDTNFHGTYVQSNGDAKVMDLRDYWKSIWGDGFNDKASSLNVV